MKKFRMLLTAIAVVIAGAGVFAKEFAFATMYYEDTSAPGTCNVEINLPCTEGSQVACKSNGNNVYKIENGGACQQVFRDM